MSKHFRWALFGVMTTAFAVLFLPFFSEILLAAIFAFALDPVTRRLANSTLLKKSSIYFRRKQWVAITLCLLILCVSLPVTFAIYHLYDTINEMATAGFQNTEFYQDVIRLKTTLVHYADQLINTLNLKRRVDLTAMGENFVRQLGQDAMALSAAFVTHLPEFVMYLFVFCCALYYFLAESKQVKSFLIRVELLNPQGVDRLVDIFQRSCTSTLFVSVVVGAIQASIVSIGSVVLGTGEFFLVFVVTFFLSFIPVIGAAPVALFLALLSLIKEDYGIAGAFVLIAIIAGTVDNIVRPYLIGSEEDLHPIVALLAILGAIVVFGLPGLFLGPVIAMATSKLYKAYLFEEPPASE